MTIGQSRSAMVVTAAVFAFFFLDSVQLFYTSFFAVKWAALLLFPLATLLYPMNPRRVGPLFISVSLYTLICLVSTMVNSGMSNDSLMFMFPFFLAYLAFLAVYFSSKDFLDHYITIMRWVMAGLFWITIPLTVFPAAFEQGRFNGVFFNANTNAGLFVVMFAFLLLDVDVSKGYRKAYILFQLVGCAYFVYLTQSRWPLAVIVNITALHILVFRVNARFPVWMRVLAGFVVFAAGLYLSTATGGVLDLAVGDRSFFDISNRLNIIESQMASFHSAPLFGRGLVIDMYTAGARYGGELAYTDILSYSGVFGFLAIMVAIGLTIRAMIVQPEERGRHLYAFLAVLLLSVFEAYISNVGGLLSLLVWFCFAGAGHAAEVAAPADLAYLSVGSAIGSPDLVQSGFSHRTNAL